VAGFRLAGVRGVEVNSSPEALQLINKLVQEPDIGLIIISEDLSAQLGEQLNEIRAKRPIPLIYELPPPIAKPKKMDYRALLRQVLGV